MQVVQYAAKGRIQQEILLATQKYRERHLQHARTVLPNRDHFRSARKDEFDTACPPAE